MTPTPASVIYPELPDPLTPGDLQQLFSPSFDEQCGLEVFGQTTMAELNVSCRPDIRTLKNRASELLQLALMSVFHRPWRKVR